MVRNDGVWRFSRMKAYREYVDCEKMSYGAFIPFKSIFVHALNVKHKYRCAADCNLFFKAVILQASAE